MNLVDTVIFGIIVIFIIATTIMISFAFLDKFYPVMKNIAEKDTQVNPNIDLVKQYSFGYNMSRIALFIFLAIPFVIIAVKYFWEREPVTY